MSSVIDISAATTIDDAFPQADPGASPFGYGVLVQLRTPRRFSQGGIELPDEAQDQDRWMTTVGKVVTLGPLAFKNRETSEDWPEGAWCKVGDFVRIPKWGGDRWEVPTKKSDGRNALNARFVIYKDRELIARIYGDPLAFRDYV